MSRFLLEVITTSRAFWIHKVVVRILKNALIDQMGLVRSRRLVVLPYPYFYLSLSQLWFSLPRHHLSSEVRTWRFAGSSLVQAQKRDRYNRFLFQCIQGVALRITSTLGLFLSRMS